MTDDEVEITIRLPKGRAEALAEQLSDWMCWAAGFDWGSRSAEEWSRPFIPDRHHLRDFNVDLKDALNRSEKQ